MTNENTDGNSTGQIEVGCSIEAREFVRSLAHNFNNILSSILGHSELIRMDRSASDRIQDRAATISQSVHRGHELAQRLIALDAEPANPDAVDLQDVLNPLIMRFRESLSSDVRFVASICEDVQVMVDPTHLRLAMSELLLNGRDFSEDGVLLLTISEEELPDSILISPTVEASRWLRARVEDSGVGFSGIDPKVLFAPSFSTRKKSLGIGLTIVDRAVRENGIGLDASGTYGGIFDLYLPIVSELKSDTEISIGEGKAYVWIVEDEEALLDFMKESLEMEGYTVRAFSRPTDLLEVLQPGSDDQPDLLLLDVALPEMSGPELLAELQLRGCNPKVLWSSGHGPNSHLVYKDATSAFLQKPYTPRDLVEAVRKAT